MCFDEPADIASRRQPKQATTKEANKVWDFEGAQKQRERLKADIEATAKDFRSFKERQALELAAKKERKRLKKEERARRIAEGLPVTDDQDDMTDDDDTSSEEGGASDEDEIQIINNVEVRVPSPRKDKSKSRRANPLSIGKEDGPADPDDEGPTVAASKRPRKEAPTTGLSVAGDDLDAQPSTAAEPSKSPPPPRLAPSSSQARPAPIFVPDFTPAAPPSIPTVSVEISVPAKSSTPQKQSAAQRPKAEDDVYQSGEKGTTSRSPSPAPTVASSRRKAPHKVTAQKARVEAEPYDQKVPSTSTPKRVPGSNDVNTPVILDSDLEESGPQEINSDSDDNVPIKNLLNDSRLSDRKSSRRSTPSDGQTSSDFSFQPGDPASLGKERANAIDDKDDGGSQRSTAPSTTSSSEPLPQPNLDVYHNIGANDGKAALPIDTSSTPVEVAVQTSPGLGHTLFPTPAKARPASRRSRGSEELVEVPAEPAESSRSGAAELKSKTGSTSRHTRFVDLSEVDDEPDTTAANNVGQREPPSRRDPTVSTPTVTSKRIVTRQTTQRPPSNFIDLSL